jgi:hypothetical protein
MISQRKSDNYMDRLNLIRIFSIIIKTKNKMAKITSFDTKVKAINIVQIHCERKQMISDSMLYKKFKVTGVISKLLDAAYIIPNGSKGYYIWNTTEAHEAIVNSLWKRNSIEDVEEATSEQTTNVSERVMEALRIIKKYDIKKEAEFILDYMKDQL